MRASRCRRRPARNCTPRASPRSAAAVARVRSAKRLSWRCVAGPSPLFLVPQVVEARSGAELLVDTEMLVLGEELRHVAVRIVEVAERERLRDARIDARRRCLRVDTGLATFGEARVDAFDAERALGGDGDARVVLPPAL